MRLCRVLFLLMVMVGVVSRGWCVRFSELVPEENRWLKGKEEGWYFYNEQDEEEQQEEEQVVLSPPPPPPAETEKEPERESEKEPAGPRPLTVEWFRQHYDEVLSRAIDNPTPENVKAYLFLQRVILDKSTNFAYAVRNAVYSEPLLDENTRIPLASAMRAALFRLQEKSVDEAFSYLSTKSGLWFFFRSDCQFCEWQYPILKKLCEKYHFKLMPVSMDGGVIPSLKGQKVWVDMGQSKRLGIVVVPAVALAVPDPERPEIIVVSQGVLSLDSLEQRILTAAIERRLLPSEIVDNVDIFRRGLLTPEQIANAPMEDDPVKLVNYIREQLMRSWGIEDAGGGRQ